MRSLGASLILVTVAAVVACSDASNSTSTPDQGAVVADVRSRLTSLHTGFVITQVEFQPAADSSHRVFVIQIDDPLEVVRSAEDALFGPLHMYRDAVGPLKPDMESLNVDSFILSYRDPQQTVIEITPEQLWRYRDGELDDAAFANVVKITANTGG